MRELIRSLAGQRTVILSSHILPEVSQLCQRVLIINHGRIVAEDTPERLTTDLQSGLVVRLQVAQAPQDALGAIQAVPGVCAVKPLAAGLFEVSCERGQDSRVELAALAVQRNWGLLELRALSLSLEDIFLQLTTDELPEQQAEEGAAEKADDAAESEEVQP